MLRKQPGDISLVMSDTKGVAVMADTCTVLPW